MVSVGLTRSFVLLGFLFFLAQARQGSRLNKNDLVLPAHKELHGSDLPASGEGNLGLGVDGRKMMMHSEGRGSDGDEKKRVQNGEINSGISSGATHTERKCLFQGQRVSVSSNGHYCCKRYSGESSFVDATFDYHGPKFHPPKHN